jgi:hypothetical protein
VCVDGVFIRGHGEGGMGEFWIVLGRGCSLIIEERMRVRGQGVQEVAGIRWLVTWSATALCSL